MLWEVPEDHTYRLDYGFLKHLVNGCFEVERISGVSMLFGIPWWGIFLAKLPGNVAIGILKFLDRIALRMPSLGDVIIVCCKPISERLQR